MGLKNLVVLATIVQGNFGFELPKFSDVFKSFQPYEDGAKEILDYNEEELGDPRLGFVQVGLTNPD